MALPHLRAGRRRPRHRLSGAGTLNREGTLLDVLLSAVQESPDQVIVQVAGDGSEQVLTYPGLLQDARRVAGGLRASGLRPGRPVIVLPGSSTDFLPSFWGALAAGLVPVPLAPVPDRIAAVWEHLDRPPLLATAELSRLASPLSGAGPSPALLALEQLRTADPIGDLHQPARDDVAFLQFSSGSTGAPKGVVLSHANVVANLHQARTAGAATAADVIVSWLPYFHDMGLIGAHLTPLSLGIKQVKLDAADFGRRPALWYETAARHAATLLPMASFALALTLRRVSADEVAALDLSSVRLVGVGAEPIPVATWRRFSAHLAPAGLRPSALVPVYGLAEATLAVAFPPLGEVAEPLVLDRQALSAGRAVDVAAEPGGRADQPVELFDVGYAVQEGELRIVDDQGVALADSLVGQIEFRGPNVASGYHERPEDTESAFVDGWLRTGDVGFLRRGRLCVTGRAKDVLFVHGQKFHAHDLESVVAATPDVPSGRVAVVGFSEPVSGGERVAVFVTSRTPPTVALAPALVAVRARVREALGYAEVSVLPIAPEDFPRTTSGKVQRSVLRQRLASGAYADLEAEVVALLTEPGSVSGPPPSRSELEALITRIWAEVLGVPATSITPDDRFLAIGGSSLSAMHVLARLEETFDRSLSPSLLRDCGTVAALAEQLTGHPDAPAAEQTPLLSPRVGDPAVVVGMACRFPDADTPEAFWQNLVDGRDSVTEVPSSRWRSASGARARWGAFLDDVAGFDAGFFGIDPAEAAAMDPHARVFLEVAHEALERAGYAGERRRGRRIGVFVAVGESGYATLLEQALDGGVTLPPSALVGNLRSVIAARLAHFLDLSGPVMAVDTACSSALVALHLARRSLEAGECDAAVVGGVSLNLTPTGYRLLEAAQALSPTGRSRAFSSGADGFVPGEGAAALVLEPLSVAKKGGDLVLAVVRGTTVNNDGRSLSLMAPNPLMQEAVIAEAYREARIDPATVSYVEAHGTGTAIGDPIEARSLMRTFGAAHGDRPRGLGSVKTNVGHLLNAAGLPSLLKVVLSLGHRALPPTLHHAGPSPSFDLAAAGFDVVTELRDWTADGPLRAGINGFGFGGTNAHVILEEAPRPAVTPQARTPGPRLLTLSAATEPALRVAARRLATHTRAHPDVDEADLVDSASTARDAGSHRLALVTDADLAERLDRAGAAPTVGGRARRRPRVALLFSGQGTQVPGLGRSLRSQPVYRRVLDELSAATGEVRGRSLAAWSVDDVTPAELAETEVAQPLLVAYAIALAAQLEAWGVRGDAVVGHSVGELAALAVAGALTPVEAVRFAAERGRLMQQRCPVGSMAALVGTPAEVQAVIDSAGLEVSVAAVNGPSRVVVSGTDQAVEQLVDSWAGRSSPGQRQGSPVQRLAVTRPFHSAGMDPALDPVRRLAAALAPQPWRTPLLSTVTVEWGPALDAAYFVDQARQPVLFAAAVQRLLAEGYDTLLTVGPQTALRGLVAATVRAHDGAADVTVLSALGPGDDDGAALLGTVGRLWERGVAVTRPVEHPPRVRHPVPTYPFERSRYWLPEAPDPGRRPAAATAPPVSPLLHRLAWQQTPLPAGAVLTSVGVVGSHPTLLAALSDRLARRGVRVHTCPADRLDELPAVSVLVLLAGPSAELDDVDALDAVTSRAAVTTLPLARFLTRRPTPLVVVTEDAALTGAAPERGRPGQAVLTGLALALAEESRHGVRVVDLSTLDDDLARIDAVVRELDAPPAAGPAESVAWRTGRRLARSPRPESVDVRDRPALPSNGCYLITGGGGGVGAAVARALARRGAPRLYLVGRATDCADGLVEELDRMGARTHYLAADCAIPAEVDALVAALPRLDGVFHGAGILVPGLLAAASVAELEAGWAAKVRGSYLLSRALQRGGNRPTVFVCCSSITSALPGLAGGLGAYTAGSAFLDAFAAAEQHAGRPTQVLNFAAWTGTGMAASAGFRAHAAAREVPQIRPEQAVEATLDAVTVNATQLVVIDSAALTSPVPPAARTRVTRSDPAPAGPPGRPTASWSTHPDVAAPDPPANGSVRELVAGLVAAELGQRRDELDDDASLLALGLDSLAAVDLVRKLESRLGRQLPTTLLFEHPSIAQLTAYLESSPAADPPRPPPPRPASEPFPLTPVQLAFHTSGRLHPSVAVYAYLRQTIVGALDPRLLARSLRQLEQRHPMLRLRIRPGQGQPRQEVRPVDDGDWPEWFVVRPLTSDLSAAEDELCNRVFDLAEEGPVRAVLLQEGPERASLLLVLHHAAADGASLNVLCAELWQVYTAQARHRPAELAPLASTFRDHVDLLEEHRSSDDFAADLRYWAERLGNQVAPAALPDDGHAEDDPAPPLTARQFSLDRDQTRALAHRAAELDVSLFHLVLTGYLAALAGWTGDPQVRVNVARSGREARLADIGRLVGPFADTLPLAVTVDAQPPGDLPRAVRAAWRESEQHGSVSTLDLARLLPAAAAGPRTAAPVSFSFARFGGELPADCPVRIVETAARTASAATRLSLLCWEFDGALRFSWNYPAHLFAAPAVERFTRDLLARLSLLGKPGPTVEEPTGPLPSIVRRVREQCRRAPDAVAVEDDEGSLSYGELDRAAGQVASRLRARGIRPRDRVALLAQPGRGAVTGLLGILYAGAGWVPLDPAHPPARLRDQLDRAQVAAVVCDGPSRDPAALLGPRPVVLVDAGPATEVDDLAIPDPDPENLAYVIFTSGTTAQPKGVPVTHGAVTTYLDWAIATFGYRAGDRMLATASICFDASVRQLLAPLLVGATIVAPSRDTVRDPGRLLELVERHGVTVWSSVPTLWEHLLRSAERRTASGGGTPDLSRLRWVHVGGEALSPVAVRRWFDLFGSGPRIVNLYGPTEATINATCHVVDARPDDSVTRIPIGRPVAETVVDVVGPEGVSCATGEPGELWLAGPGVTRGYLDQPELTAAAFAWRDGVRYCRTGDRVVRRADEALEFLGRLDQQVKIRGHRVEPAEVESVLREHPAVEQAVVVAQPAGAGCGQRLVGYVRPTPESAAVTSELLRAHLVTRLPDYLVPAQLLVVDELPVTVTGKLDLTRLATLVPRPSGSDPVRQPPRLTPPLTPIEQVVASVWCELLGVDQVSSDDDFFALGGDSIAVLEVFARLEAHLPRLPAPTVLYRHRTLAGLAAALAAAAVEPPAPAHEQPSRRGPYPLGPAQRGFLLSEALSPHTRSSWLACFRLTGPLDPDQFQRAVNRLVERHPMLRTVVLADRRPPVQDEVPGPARLDVRYDVIERDQLRRRLAEERRHRFDLTTWPLIRLQLLRLSPQEHALVVHTHHLLGDGYSVVVLAQDLLTLYDEVAAGGTQTLPELRSTFRDYVALLAAERSAEPSLTTGRPGADHTYRPPSVRRTGATVAEAGEATLSLDRQTTARLRQLAAAAKVTPYVPLLTAYYRSLARLTQQPDLLLGVAVTGRDHALPDLHRLVGPLATVVPVPLHGLGRSVAEQLPQVAEAVLRARADGATIQQRLQHAPGSAALSSLGAQFLFSYLDFDALGPLAGEQLQLTWDDAGTDLEPPPVGTDLLLTARSTDGRLEVTVRSAAGVLPAPDLEAFAADVRAELITAAGSPAPATTASRAVAVEVLAATPVLDAALIGYLPAPRELASLVGLPASVDLRESIRSALFPDRRPRLLEELTTPLGRSGFFCLPVFADELSPRAGGALAGDVARAVEAASDSGARAVSLAGMIPAHTGYGFDVLRQLDPAAATLTTGHAVTAASVVATTIRALHESGAQLAERSLCVVGLGSIGRSALELLLTVTAEAPQRVLLCDLAGRVQHLSELTAALRTRGYQADFAVCAPDAALPDLAYDADLLLAAISADRPVLDPDRLRPGAIVVDDSFPHCFDPASAIHRMADRGDVLMVGGGLLSAGPSLRTPVDDPLLRRHAPLLTGLRLPDTVAACQLEALLLVNRPDLSPVRGVVDATLVLAYWEALAAQGIVAAPLHLQQQLLGADRRGTRLR